MISGNQASLSWADIEFGISAGTNKEPTVKRPKKRSRGYCYTCKPRGKVLKHIIRGCESPNVIFHFDLHQRPLILVTPKKHYETLYDIPTEEQIELFGSVKVFCDFWGIRDYQVSYNNGEWQTHTHFHLKIKACEKIINRLRRDHFTMQGLTNNYIPPPTGGKPCEPYPQT